MRSLQYLSLTRLYIFYAVNIFSQFMHFPSSTHWTTVKRVLRYLNDTSLHGIHLERNSKPSLHSFSNFDQATNPDDLTYTSGNVIFLVAHQSVGHPENRDLLLEVLLRLNLLPLLLPLLS